MKASQLAVLGFALAATAEAGSIVLPFEGLQDQEQVLCFNNGGTGALGSGPGPNYGTTFGPDAVAILSDDSGGT